MSKINYQALREAAEKAGEDKWQAKKINGDFFVIRHGSYTRQHGYTSYQPIAEIDCKPVRDFVAKANPATVLELLDELDAAKQRIAELESLKEPQLPQPAVPECYQRLLHHAYGMTMGHDWNKGTMAGHHREKLCKAVEDCRAAMLQGADGTLTNEGTMPATKIKPVADLYSIAVPGGRSTTYSTDAAEASDCRVMGWTVQEYVKLERYQAAMLGAEPVSQSYTLREGVAAIRNSGIAIDADKIQAERDALNEPTCWCLTCRPVTMTDMRFVVCPKCGNKRCPHANDHRNACTGSNESGQEGSAYPAAPQKEAYNG